MKSKEKSKESRELDELMYEKNISVKQASQIGGVGHKTIYRWLRGTASPNPIIYRKVIAKLKKTEVNL